MKAEQQRAYTTTERAKRVAAARAWKRGADATPGTAGPRRPRAQRIPRAGAAPQRSVAPDLSQLAGWRAIGGVVTGLGRDSARIVRRRRPPERTNADSAGETCSRTRHNVPDGAPAAEL
jgi:hypothetical protein